MGLVFDTLLIPLGNHRHVLTVMLVPEGGTSTRRKILPHLRSEVVLLLA